MADAGALCKAARAACTPKSSGSCARTNHGCDATRRLFSDRQNRIETLFALSPFTRETRPRRARATERGRPSAVRRAAPPPRSSLRETREILLRTRRLPARDRHEPFFRRSRDGGAFATLRSDSPQVENEAIPFSPTFPLQKMGVFIHKVTRGDGRAVRNSRSEKPSST